MFKKFMAVALFALTLGGCASQPKEINTMDVKANSICDKAERLAGEFIKRQYASRPELGAGPLLDKNSAYTYQEICRKGVQQGIKGDSSQLEALLAEIHDHAISADIEPEETHDLIRDMAIVLVFQAGYIEGTSIA